MAWAPAYVTAQELWDWIEGNPGINQSSLLVDHPKIEARAVIAIEAASRAVDLFANRQFGLVTAVETRYYTAQYDRELRRWVVDIDDLMTATGLIVEADLVGDGDYDYTITDYALTPHNAAPKNRPWTRIIVRSTEANPPNATADGVKVTAKWGWTTVPVAVEQATLLQAHRLEQRSRSAFGIAFGQDIADMRLIDKVDPDLAVTLRPYVRHWAVA